MTLVLVYCWLEMKANANQSVVPLCWKRQDKNYPVYVSYTLYPSIMLPPVFFFFHSCRFEGFPRSWPVTFDWDRRSCPAQFVLWHLSFLCECNLLWYWLKKPLCSVPQSYWSFFFYYCLLRPVCRRFVSSRNLVMLQKTHSLSLLKSISQSIITLLGVSLPPNTTVRNLRVVFWSRYVLFLEVE